MLVNVNRVLPAASTYLVLEKSEGKPAQWRLSAAAEGRCSRPATVQNLMSANPDGHGFSIQQHQARTETLLELCVDIFHFRVCRMMGCTQPAKLATVNLRDRRMASIISLCMEATVRLTYRDKTWRTAHIQLQAGMLVYALGSMSGVIML